MFDHDNQQLLALALAGSCRLLLQQFDLLAFAYDYFFDVFDDFGGKSGDVSGHNSAPGFLRIVSHLGLKTISNRQWLTVNDQSSISFKIIGN